MSQTNHPLIVGSSNVDTPLWAIFCDCTGIFDKDADSKTFEQKPIIRPVITIALVEAAAKDPESGQMQGIRIFWSMVAVGVGEPPEELKKKRKIAIAIDEPGRITPAENCSNFIGLTYNPNPAPHVERCRKGRATMEEKIKAVYATPLFVPNQSILGVDGAPVH